ncbi:MAG: pyridoxine 5'-phosphate synthase [Nitrospirae bacterium]|nr:pyridoxine 5'-phosphate synthase [Nitrospirota bacterium]
MAKLGVNIDHVATVRQARRGVEPDPVHAAVLAELAGADGITIHLREDRRHIQDRDLRILRETVRTSLNLEMACSDEIIAIALEVRPDMVTLVPEKREELTTEGGLDVRLNRDKVADAVRRLRDGGIFVSLFIDPDLDQVKESSKVRADAVEIHTGGYADAATYEVSHSQYEKIFESCKLAHKLKMVVNAGHGLNYHNVRQIARIPEIYELNIGHSIVSRAVLVGMERAVREMKGLVS